MKYGDRINFFDGQKQEEFRRKYTSWANIQKAVGQNHTTMVYTLGAGDPKKGQEALDVGKAKGHFYESDGLWYSKGAELRREEGGCEEKGIKRTRAIDNSTYEKLADEYKPPDWVNFAVNGKRQKALPSGHNEKTTLPASEEAQERLQSAYDELANVVKNIKTAGRSIAQIFVTKPGKKKLSGCKI